MIKNVFEQTMNKKEFWFNPTAHAVRMTTNGIPMPLGWYKITEQMFWDFLK